MTIHSLDERRHFRLGCFRENTYYEDPQAFFHFTASLGLFFTVEKLQPPPSKYNYRIQAGVGSMILRHQDHLALLNFNLYPSRQPGPSQQP